jgi:hypothetical protein
LIEYVNHAQGWVNTQLGPSWGPPAWSVATALFGAAVVIGPLLLVVLYYQLVERWVIGWIQVRKGPNRVGWKGVLQPIADAIKLLMKEQMVPTGANKILFFLAPIVAGGARDGGWAVVPFMPGWVVAERGRRHPRAPRDDLARHLRHHHRRLGVELEVRVPRRDARDGADGLLRARHGLRAGAARSWPARA